MRSCPSSDSRSLEPPASDSEPSSNSRHTAGRAPTERSHAASEIESSAAASGWLQGSAGSTVAASATHSASTRCASAASAGAKNGGHSPRPTPSATSQLVSPGSAT